MSVALAHRQSLDIGADRDRRGGGPSSGRATGMHGVPISQAPPLVGPLIDRERTCPLLLRVFPKPGAHHRLEDFHTRGVEPTDEIQIYT